MLLLNKKVILVTGARRGIGRVICEVFARESVVVYAGVRDIGVNNITLDSEKVNGAGSASYIL